MKGRKNASSRSNVRPEFLGSVGYYHPWDHSFSVRKYEDFGKAQQRRESLGRPIRKFRKILKSSKNVGWCVNHTYEHEGNIHTVYWNGKKWVGSGPLYFRSCRRAKEELRKLRREGIAPTAEFLKNAAEFKQAMEDNYADDMEREIQRDFERDYERDHEPASIEF